jgi:hypothetical protein
VIFVFIIWVKRLIWHMWFKILFFGNSVSFRSQMVFEFWEKTDLVPPSIFLVQILMDCHVSTNYFSNMAKKKKKKKKKKKRKEKKERRRLSHLLGWPGWRVVRPPLLPLKEKKKK